MNLKRNLFTCAGMMMLFLLAVLTGCNKNNTKPDDQQPPEGAQFSLSDFSSAEACKDCHPNHYNEWKGSMHAYAFLDPINTIWMISSRDAIGAEELGQFCVQCHSPIGMLTGETPVGFNKEDVDPLVKEGITCDACHLMQNTSQTALDKAVYHYDVSSGKRYGSIIDPDPNDFHTSEAKSFFSQSNVCLPCHDLFNKMGLRVEVTFTEWLESPFSAMGSECQSCHMETYSGEAYVGGPQRELLHRHDFVGVDIALIDNFPNKVEQRQKIEQLLQNSVVFTVTVPDAVQPDSTLDIVAEVKNIFTGHDIPSSVTFVRQMWLEVTVTSNADTIYKSGFFDANGDLKDEHSELEPNGDPDLALFQSAIFQNGQPGNVFNADSIRMGSIPAFKSGFGIYSIDLPANLGNTVDVKIRLRFRTFSPYLIRSGAPELIERIPIFEMEEFVGSVAVTR